MRSILAFLPVLFLFGCHFKTPALTKKEFAEVYLDSLSKKYPSAKFELGPDLIITSKKGDLDYRHYIDNAFIAYQAEPDSINSIIARYLASSADLYLEHEPVKLENIVPVIKPAEYLDEINSLAKDGKSFPVITEKYNDQLIIVYAEDAEKSIRYLTDDDLKTLSVSMNTIKSVALSNLDKLLPNIQRQGDNGIYMITAGGDYEASLILLSSLWTTETFPVDGDFIIAIPNRDLLLVTGSKNKNGIAKIKAFAAESYKTGSYPVSNKLYKWTGKTFEQYE